MEKQNKNQRDKCNKEERKRLIKLCDLSYASDPRIQAALKLEAEAKEAVKQQKKAAKLSKYKKVEEVVVVEAKVVEDAKVTAEKKAADKEAKKIAGKKYR